MKKSQKNYTTWTSEMISTLIRLYPDHKNVEVAKIINVSPNAVQSKAFKLSLKKDPAFMRMCIEKGMFKPGQVPPNKGLKQSEYMSAAAIEKTASTRFKKGDLPRTAYNEPGKITIRAHRSGRLYQFICVKLGKWKELHVFKWEQVNGKLPKGFCLWFKDGNSLNAEIDNLELITRAENMLRNSGALNLTDNSVATFLATKSRKLDKKLKEEYLKHPQLIELKRQQLKLQRIIKNHGTEQ